MTDRGTMSLVGFMQAGNVTVYAGSWRHPATEHGFLDQRYYQKLGRTLEEGCFDLMFFDDRLAMPGIYGGSVAEAVRLGARPVKLDLEHRARRDRRRDAAHRAGRHLLDDLLLAVPRRPDLRHARPPLRRSRAWNVVTSVNDSEAQNFGVDAAPRSRRALRPRRRVPRGDHRAVGHLGRRRPRARPRERGRSPTRAKVHELDHDGE